jgi:hypothetical protein
MIDDYCAWSTGAVGIGKSATVARAAAAFGQDHATWRDDGGGSDSARKQITCANGNQEQMTI